HRGAGERGLGLGHGGRRRHLVAPRAQHLDERVPHVGLVLHHEHASPWPRPPVHRDSPSRAGSLSRKTAPPPSRGRTVSSPACCSTIEWQMDKPRPVDSFVEKKGSKIRRASPSLMPGPRSANSASTWPSSRRALTRTSPPFGWASQAFRIRLT